ncbi:MAG: hypothetical protein IJC85_04475 [Oscillospiraceae bacterium]|nr:hypothetical protein [Oscillospiraceae bacterium]
MKKCFSWIGMSFLFAPFASIPVLAEEVIPATGTTTDNGLWGILLVVALLLIVAVIVLGIFSKKKDD